MRNGEEMSRRADRRPGRRRARAVVVAGVAAIGGWNAGGVGASGDDEGSDSPLADLLNWGDTDPAEQRRQELEVQELTSECMRELGWEYEPVDYSAMNYSDPMAEDWELQATDPEAFGERYGYGIMRQYELYDAVWLSGDGAANTVPFEEDTFVDPNQEYVESLSPSEMEQYYEDLYGPQTFEEGDGGMTATSMPAPEDMGCQGRASEEVWSQGSGMDSDVQDRIGEFYEAIQDDPRLQSASDEWAECMGDTIDGYVGWDGGPVASPDDMWSVFDAKKYEAQGLERVEFEDESELDGLEYASASFDEDGGGVAWVGSPEAIPESEVEALTEEEIEAWRLDQECQADADLKDVQRELEQDLVDQLLEEFPELATAGADGD